MKRTGNTRKPLMLIILGLLSTALTTSLLTEAHEPGVVLTGLGTATINGVFSPGEWNNAGSITFQANLPPNDGGGTTPTTLFAMNDGVNLYLGLKIARPSFGGATSPSFEFDNDHDGLREDGDDVFGMAVGLFSPATFIDAFRFFCFGGTAICGPADTAVLAGFPPPGTNDGTTAATSDGSFTYIEISHPLNSADDAHDFSLSPGNTVGFAMNLRLFSLIPACNFGVNCFADTVFPPLSLNFGQFLDRYGDIVIASPIVPVSIDIKPGSDPNSINPKSRGVIPVAILSSSTFDAFVSVDTTSLTFGRTGNENSLVFCNGSPTNVNGDAFPDLMCHFDTQQTGFQSGDTTGKLKGKTVGGTPIEGTDSVRIVP